MAAETELDSETLKVHMMVYMKAVQKAADLVQLCAALMVKWKAQRTGAHMESYSERYLALLSE